MPTRQTFGVIFDMDGVLVDSWETHFLTWRECCRRYGRDCTLNEFMQGFGRTSREFIRETWADPPDDDFIHAFDQEKELLYRDSIRANFPRMPGAIELIRSLNSEEIPMAVGSSGPRKNIDEVLRLLGADELIKIRISGSDVTRGKPDPEVFLKAAAAMNLPPERCVVLEDAPVGIEAALGAGMKCVGVISNGRSAGQLSRATHLVADDLQSVSLSLLEHLVNV